MLSQTGINLETRDPRMTTNQWNAELYDTQHAFVAEFGNELVGLLSPQSGESILDLGCGTGTLTQAIAAHGAHVIGVDSALSMIEQARQNYPELQFELADATNLPFVDQFDSVFSNAVLHWVKEPEAAIASVWQALKPGGRFVAEFGGKGNVQAILRAINHAFTQAGLPISDPNPWYFPSIAEYASLLEQQGFEVVFATLFSRITPLDAGENGLQNWLEMFANSFFQDLDPDQKSALIADIETQLRPQLYRDDTWFADYRRIRITAIKPLITPTTE